MTLEIRGAVLDGAATDIVIRDGTIAVVRPHRSGPDPAGDAASPADASGGDATHRIMDAPGLHVFPSFRNGHTHVAMVLFRGYGDDMPLMEWLRTRIWPAEAQLTEDDVYAGARLGILEMIRGGTTFFNEMYWHRPALVRAAEEMGVRALIGQTIIDLGDSAMLQRQKDDLARLASGAAAGGRGRVQFCAAPHSIYTVSPEDLRWTGEMAAAHDLLLHIHLSETQEEVDKCVAAHGVRPAVLLDRLGLVNERLVAAHGQFLNDDELKLLGAAGAAIVTNPAANLKLATGGIFPWRAARQAGVRTCLGTDGAASNNTLSMIEGMKLAALLQKHREQDATVLPAAEALAMATATPAEVFRHGSGRIAEGEPADLILVDFSRPATQPLHDPVSQLVYAADASCVHTTICDGRVLMHAGVVEVCDEQEVIAAAAASVRALLERVPRAASAMA
ncbi:MAG TPA: amidohydrolase [Longimicrobiales bacterium]|nr:amidohydrolase [Longimicrobiales bacterium]